jgi:hypothetical protein
LAIDDSGTWWVGSDTGDIEPYLVAYTQPPDGYPITTFHPVRCACGHDRFRLQRAGDIARRSCAACGTVAYTCRQAEDWEEAADEEDPEAYACVECRCEQANVGVGFAGYGEDHLKDAVKWFYFGVRCAACGVLGCFTDGKVGWGPAVEVYRDA